MKKEDKNKISGIAGTILFHIGALLLLIFMALRTPLPLPGEEGVMVNFGYDETGMGVDQQMEQAPAETVQQIETPPQETEEEQYLTQDVEEAPAIEKKKEEPKKEPEKVKPKPEPEPEPVKEIVKPEPQPEPQPQVNQKALYKGKSTSSAQGGQEGITGEPGDQGSQTGVAGVPNYTGKGGTGTQGEGTGSEGTGGDGNGPGGEGISYALGGRGSISLHKPSYESREQGKVVVTIKVDRQGKVISAVPGAKGTNVSDQTLWNLAKDAALRSTFSPDSNAPDFQVGTITYNFIRQN
jgi:outer membrane biosynthesis protein TonB